MFCTASEHALKRQGQYQVILSTKTCSFIDKDGIGRKRSRMMIMILLLEKGDGGSGDA